ncbi:peroxiredoxin family protein [Propionibacteriaceae bacterium Y1700]|uniref:peroxiredoxin family protein n=1 Tax=Microlunatus sp. Y1700 TaxID=3418487 RepID=UPI003DA717D9
MITVLTGAVVILTVLVVLDLSLTVLLIKALREGKLNSTPGGNDHDHPDHPEGGFEPTAPTIRPGSPVPPLGLTTADGRPLSQILAEGRWLVAFVSPGCEGCEQERPVLTEWADSHAARGERVAVVVTESSQRIDAFVADYPFAVVAADGVGDGEAISAFGVATFPSYVRIADGAVTSTALELPGHEVVLIDD